MSQPTSSPVLPPPQNGAKAPGAGGNAGAAAPAPARPPKPDMSTVLSNLGNLLAMDRDGKLSQLQLVQLRSLIYGQTRHITLQTLLKNQPNPLLTLPAHLNPTLPWKEHAALLSAEQFQTNINNATNEAQRILLNLLPMSRVKELLHINVDERNRMLAADPVLKNKFTVSVTFYTKGASGFINSSSRPPGSAPSAPASGASTPRPLPAQSSTSTSQSIARPPPSGPPGSGPNAVNKNQTAGSVVDLTGQQTRTEIPSQPAPRPLPPPEPVEPEDERRKRKVREWLKELAPGAEQEVGVDEIWSELLDSFVQESGRGAARLAKHRKADKVGVKDMSFFLEKTYGITVPGFNAQNPDRIHVAPEGDKKRSKVVVPRAARTTKGKDDEA